MEKAERAAAPPPLEQDRSPLSLTFPPAGQLDADDLVDQLAQLQGVLLAGHFVGAMRGGERA